eukprot:1229914-Amphidinium_carterae.1
MVRCLVEKERDALDVYARFPSKLCVLDDNPIIDSSGWSGVQLKVLPTLRLGATMAQVRSAIYCNQGCPVLSEEDGSQKLQQLGNGKERTEHIKITDGQNHF